MMTRSVSTRLSFIIIHHHHHSPARAGVSTDATERNVVVIHERNGAVGGAVGV
jgi:hypothetical protein